jgi:signal transduction histidine kinase/streptogramin lyase
LDAQLWAAYANGGLFFGAAEHFDKTKTAEGGEFLNLITSIAADSKGGLWIGTLGLGLRKLKEGTVTRITTENGLADDEIMAVAAQSDDAIWAGTRAGTVHRLTERGIESFGRESGLTGDPVCCILPGASGTLWVGTENGGLLRLEGRRFVSADLSSALAGAPVRALCEDARGRLWIGTQGRGLACRTDGQIEIWDVKSGFPDNEVNAIVADDSGELWICTRKGIHVMPLFPGRPAAGTLPALQLVYEYDRSSAAVFKRGWPQAVKGRDGRLWFATPAALCVLEPRDFHAAFTPLRVEVEGIMVNGEPLPFRSGAKGAGTGNPKQPLRFPSNLRTREVEFTVPCLISPEQVQFAHRLDHFDSDWVEGGERRVRYSGLPYGQYQFRVRAKNLDGTWGEENASLVFDFPPPLWRSPSVLSVSAVFAVFAIGGVVRLISHRRLRLKLAQLGQQQAMERERMRIARDMHDEIGSKLARVSYISELALHDEVPSRQSIRSIATTIRDLLQTLDEIVWAVNPQNDTLENLAAYLGHFATEYLQNTSVECEVNIPPGLPVRPLTAETRHNLFLAFEEAVGNALRHSSATKVSVDMECRNGSFQICIRDNGRGFDSRTKAAAPGPAARGKTGNGLVNMRQRLECVGGEARIESRAGEGTQVTFKIPVKAKPANA